MKILVLIALFFGEYALAADKVEGIACSFFAATMSYAEILQLPKSPDPLNELLAIVNDATKQQCWSNTMWMIGVLGNETQVEVLINRISEGSGELSRNEWDAKSTAILALGLLANKGGEKAVSFLEMLVSKKDEKGYPFAWTPPQGWRNGSNLYLARRAVQALGISGRLEAKTFLEKFKNDPQLEDVIADALPFNDRVRTVGLASVYR